VAAQLGAKVVLQDAAVLRLACPSPADSSSVWAITPRSAAFGDGKAQQQQQHSTRDITIQVRSANIYLSKGCRWGRVEERCGVAAAMAALASRTQLCAKVVLQDAVVLRLACPSPADSLSVLAITPRSAAFGDGKDAAAAAAAAAQHMGYHGTGEGAGLVGVRVWLVHGCWWQRAALAALAAAQHAEHRSALVVLCGGVEHHWW
jgi:hypothetical protein